MHAAVRCVKHPAGGTKAKSNSGDSNRDCAVLRLTPMPVGMLRVGMAAAVCAGRVGWNVAVGGRSDSAGAGAGCFAAVASWGRFGSESGINSPIDAKLPSSSAGVQSSANPNAGGRRASRSRSALDRRKQEQHPQQPAPPRIATALIIHHWNRLAAPNGQALGRGADTVIIHGVGRGI